MKKEKLKMDNNKMYGCRKTYTRIRMALMKKYFVRNGASIFMFKILVTRRTTENNISVMKSQLKL